MIKISPKILLPFLGLLPILGASAGLLLVGAPPTPPAQTVTSVTLSNTTFTSGSPDGTPVGSVNVGITPGPSFTGHLGITSTKFRLSSTTLPANVVLNGTQTSGETITLTALDGASNTPFNSNPIAITSATSPFVAVSNLNPTANSIVTVTYSPGSNATGPNDVIQMLKSNSYHYCSGDTVVYETTDLPQAIKPALNGPGTLSLKIPNVASVEPQTYTIVYSLGGYCSNVVAESAVITVPPTLPPFNPASSNIPPDVTAYPSSALGVADWPNPPNRILTVCSAGPPTCQYSLLSAAVFDAGNTNPVDFTQIKVDCGTYSYANQSGDWRSSIPLHLWIYGHCSNGSLPRFIQDGTNPPRPDNPGSFFSFIDQSYSIFELIVDNIEISNWQHGGASAPAVGLAGCNGDGNQWVTLLRNVYLHDMGQGIFKGVGECSWNFIMLNSHIARTGGQTGPAHGIYLSNVVEAGNPTPVNFTAKRSVFEQDYYGHLVKSHATSATFDCDVFIKDYSEVYAGAKEIETEQGGYAEIITNTLFVQGPWWWDNQQSNFFGMGFAAENTGGYVALPDMHMSMNNSIYINDLTGTQSVNTGQQGIPVGQYQPFDPGHIPTPWNNNTFVGPYGFWGPTGGTAMTAPYINWCWDGGQQTNCIAAGYVNGNTQVDMGCGAAVNPGGPPPGNDYACAQDQAPNGKGNLFYSTRSTAASHNWPSSGSPLGPLPNADGGTVVGWSGSGLNSTLFPLPAACTQPIGNVIAPPS